LVFININLYNFILYILNNFLKTNLEKTITKGFTDGMNPSAFDSTFTDAFTDGYIRSVFHTLTDRITDGLKPSAFDSSCHNYRRLYRRIYSVGISNTHWQIYRRYVAVGKSWYHRRNKIRRYISSRKLFFGAQIPSVKPSANGFFVFPTDIATEWGITDEEKADGRNPSVNTWNLVVIKFHDLFYFAFYEGISLSWLKWRVTS